MGPTVFLVRKTRFDNLDGDEKSFIHLRVRVTKIVNNRTNSGHKVQ